MVGIREPLVGVEMNRNVGREDRLVRACLALSLVLLGGFGVAATGGVNTAVIMFAALGGYFVVTAIAGWDPLYGRLRVSTRAEASDPGWDPTPAMATPVAFAAEEIEPVAAPPSAPVAAHKIEPVAAPPSAAPPVAAEEIEPVAESEDVVDLAQLTSAKQPEKPVEIDLRDQRVPRGPAPGSADQA